MQPIHFVKGWVEIMPSILSMVKGWAGCTINIIYGQGLGWVKCVSMVKGWVGSMPSILSMVKGWVELNVYLWSRVGLS